MGCDREVAAHFAFSPPEFLRPFGSKRQSRAGGVRGGLITLISLYFFSLMFNWNNAGRKMQSEKPTAISAVRSEPKRSVSLMSGLG